MAYWGYSYLPEYVPVGARRARAQLKASKLEKSGRKLDPVALEGRVIARSFWGKAWCKNLESYSDFANRLPRGRSYLRSGAVVDLRIGAGRLDALVAGGSLYEVAVQMKPPARQRWNGLVSRCAGRVDSVVELLRGRVPEAVLSALVDPRVGLFPAPREMRFTCSCPDSASLCKHIAAVLYGVGARLDRRPELFFTLRSVQMQDLVARGVARGALGKPGLDEAHIDEASLERLFGIELDASSRASGGRRRNGRSQK